MAPKRCYDVGRLDEAAKEAVEKKRTKVEDNKKEDNIE